MEVGAQGKGARWMGGIVSGQGTVPTLPLALVIPASEPQTGWLAVCLSTSFPSGVPGPVSRPQPAAPSVGLWGGEQPMCVRAALWVCRVFMSVCVSGCSPVFTSDCRGVCASVGG